MTNSKVLVKNDKVIVTEWSFNVGDSTGTHKHQYNYVVVPMIDGELKIIDKENKIHKITAIGKKPAIRLAVSRGDVDHIYV